MTKNEILTAAADLLDDEQMVHFDNQQLSDSLKDGYEFLALTLGFYEKATSISLVADQHWYDLQTLIPDYYRIFSAYNTTSNRWLDPTSLKGIRRVDDRWETISGNPRIWIPVGPRYIALHPVPPAAVTNAIHIYYKAFPPELANNEEPNFHADLHSILVDFIVQDLFDANLEYGKATVWFEKFMAKFKLLEDAVSHRSLPDRLWTLSCQYFPHRSYNG